MDNVRTDITQASTQSAVADAGADVLLGTLFEFDERRELIEAERFARPPVPVTAPSLIQHLVFHGPEDDLEQARAKAERIYKALKLTPDQVLPDQISASGENLSLKWERHTEFQSFTILASNYEPMELQGTWCTQPLGWDQVSGTLLVNMTLAIDAEHSDQKRLWADQDLFRFTDTERLMGSKVSQERSLVLADFRADPHGRTRFLISNRHDNPIRTGRMIQRLIEVSTYSSLSFLALPRAKDIGPKLAQIDGELRKLTEDMSRDDCDDQEILMTLTDLAAESERLSAATQFRLNASLAYARIVSQRIEELDEQRMEGRSRIGSFVKRRLDPAARTFEAVLRRQREQSERIERSAALLRGRVEVEQNRQNQDLLASMNSRAEAQFKLQKTVEGLSTVAISYYALSILGYVYAGFEAALPSWLSVKMLIAISAPLVILFVWGTVRKIKGSSK